MSINACTRNMPQRMIRKRFGGWNDYHMRKVTVKTFQWRNIGRGISAANADRLQATSDDVKLVYATVPASLHDYPGHAECASRIPAIITALEESSIKSHPNVVELVDFRVASPEDVAPAHDPRYIAALEQASDQARDVSNVLIDSAPTYLTQSTYIDALKACGAAMTLVDKVLDSVDMQGGSKSRVGFGICRPPGHHAIPTTAMGFCILNTVAVAAKYAQKRLGEGTRVAIIDWDVHHGNGTQDIFVSDPTVLFVSTHQAIYPGTGKADEVGEADGEGATINVVLPGDAGHTAALRAWDEIVEPAVRRFSPDIILVSAGFDAHWQDPLAGLQFRSTTFHELSKKAVSLAQSLCGGKLVFLLEGGYHLDALGQSVASTFAGALGLPPVDALSDPSLLRDEPDDAIKASLLESKRIHNL